MIETGLRLPLTVRPLGRYTCEIRDAIGRRITTITSNRFDCAAEAAFDVQAVAQLWADAANATAQVPEGATA